MALYAIGDTHFSSDRDKPMDIFGGRWIGYNKKLTDSISMCMQEQDTLVICGDFSWGMSLRDTLTDFRFLDSLPGKKILLKGNHDYWWETVSKMKKFFIDNNIGSIGFLHNNFFEYNSKNLLCGTRGWMYDSNDSAVNDNKVFNREICRLDMSLSAARKYDTGKEIICFMHYPPVFLNNEVTQFTDILKKYGVSKCFYGHLHSDGIKNAFNGIKDGIEYRLISADAVDFRPILLSE